MKQIKYLLGGTLEFNRSFLTLELLIRADEIYEGYKESKNYEDKNRKISKLGEIWRKIYQTNRLNQKYVPKYYRKILLYFRNVPLMNLPKEYWYEDDLIKYKDVSEYTALQDKTFIKDFDEILKSKLMENPIFIDKFVRRKFFENLSNNQIKEFFKSSSIATSVMKKNRTLSKYTIEQLIEFNHIDIIIANYLVKHNAFTREMSDALEEYLGSKNKFTKEEEGIVYENFNVVEEAKNNFLRSVSIGL